MQDEKIPADFEWLTDEELTAYFAEQPGADPKANPHLMAAVNFPDYIDRGLNGPLGGVGGTPSYPAQEEIRAMQNGAPSEFGLMTFTVNGKTMIMAQLQAHQADEAEGRESMAKAIAEEDEQRRAIHAQLAKEATGDDA